MAAVAAGAVSVAALAVVGVVLYRRPTTAQREERRRHRLAADGRIVDGQIVDASPSEAEPETVVYQYKIAGVMYECSQDVSAMPGLMEGVRLNFPVQVRYDRRNPGDSIVVAEEWNGLWHRRKGPASARDMEEALKLIA